MTCQRRQLVPLPRTVFDTLRLTHTSGHRSPRVDPATTVTCWFATLSCTTGTSRRRTCARVAAAGRNGRPACPRCRAFRGQESIRRAERRPGGAGRSGQAIVGLLRSGVPGRAPNPRSRAWPRATCGRRAPEGWPLRACGGSRGCRPASQAREVELVGGDVHLLAPDVDLDRRERDALEVGEGLERLAISPVRPVKPALEGLGRPL